MKRVTVSYAETRYKWGNLNFCEPSRFIEEIDTTFLEITKRKTQPSNDFIFDVPKKPIKLSKKSLQPSRPVSNKNLIPLNKAIQKSANSRFEHTENITEQLQVGMEVEHERFGKGKVINIEGKTPDKKAMVFFEGVGQKQLLLKFAKLKIIG
jgi:DNA helicase-2/ATP-dependent DNA helicase PcrA